MSREKNKITHASIKLLVQFNTVHVQVFPFSKSIRFQFKYLGFELTSSLKIFDLCAYSMKKQDHFLQSSFHKQFNIYLLKN